jgi:hypothetical protein
MILIIFWINIFKKVVLWILYQQFQDQCDQDKTTFTCPWVMYTYIVLPFGLCNAPVTFQNAILGIFSDLIHE